jgi:hypothetical protein
MRRACEAVRIAGLDWSTAGLALRRLRVLKVIDAPWFRIIFEIGAL